MRHSTDLGATGRGLRCALLCAAFASASTVSVDIGTTLVASITRASAADLGLVEGAAVLATFKASAVHLIPLAS